jgi:hypothetical protein
VIKLPENGTSPVSSSGWSTLSGEDASRMAAKSDDSLSHRSVGPAVPVLRLQVPVPNGTSQTARYDDQVERGFRISMLLQYFGDTKFHFARVCRH